MKDKSHEEDIAVFLFLDPIFPGILARLLCFALPFPPHTTRQYTVSILLLVFEELVAR